MFIKLKEKKSRAVTGCFYVRKDKHLQNQFCSQNRLKLSVNSY